MLRKSRPPPSCFLIRSLESRYLSCPPQQGHPGIFSLLLTKNTVCLIANKRILCYNEHGFYQISEYATVQEGALRFFSFYRIMTVYRVTWRQATKSKKCYFKRASTLWFYLYSALQEFSKSPILFTFHYGSTYICRSGSVRRISDIYIPLWFYLYEISKFWFFC